MIKFRGLTEDGKWVVGNTLIQNDEMTIIGNNFKWIDGSEFNDNGDNWWMVIEDTVEVIP
jgi:hypothetical protein